MKGHDGTGAETPYAETEALLMVLNGLEADAVLAYLQENFSVRNLRTFVDQLDRLAGLCELADEDIGP